tara:strand:+ start:51 stop:452 length:402 start_codon:yes stop_codon:yes gene_type:complete
MQIGMPLRNLIAIVGSVAAGVLGYSQLEGRLGDLETQTILIESRVDSNSSFSNRLSRGELSTAADQEQFMLIEVLSKEFNKLQENVESGMAPYDQQQALTLEFYLKRIQTLEKGLEQVKDKLAEMKANGNGAH